jgi:hypothetical protein
MLSAEILQEYVCNQIHSLKSINFCDTMSDTSQKITLFRVTTVNVKSDMNLFIFLLTF